MNAVERKQREASVEWLFRILERARQVAALSEGGLSVADALESNGQGESDEENEDKNTALPTVETVLAKTMDQQALERIKEMMRLLRGLTGR